MTDSSWDPEIPPELLKKYLDQEKMSASKLASYLNVAETTVHRWLKGEAKPTGTAKAVLWTLIGIAGIAAGATAELARRASSSSRFLGGAAIGVSAISSCVGLYKLLKDRLEKVGVDQIEEMVEVLKQKEKQEQKVKSLKQQLAEEEKKLRELEKKTSR